MLDPKYIREHADEIEENCVQRQVQVDVKGWLELDDQRRIMLQEVENLRAERNSIADKMKSPQLDRDELINRGKFLKDAISNKETELEEVELLWRTKLLLFPNITHREVPRGKDEADNLELRKVGDIKKNNKPLNHVELALKHDLIDFDRGAKVAGSKFYFLKNKLAILDLALQKFVLDYLVRDGYIPLTTPDLAKDEILIGTGYNPRGNETQIYSIEKTDLSLIGTAEITTGGYHKDEVLEEKDLPLKYVSLSHCYRTEAGAYGKESYGLYRVHQFTKVEMFIYCTPEQSEALHLEILRHEENIFKSLGIPYRIVDCCTADLGGPAFRKYDVEAWMWGRGEGQGGWGEVTSASNCTDYQARRLNVRFKNKEGLRYVHTLNGTGMATSRGMIALLENYQNEDGTISIPEALVPYCGFDTIG